MEKEQAAGVRAAPLASRISMVRYRQSILKRSRGSMYPYAVRLYLPEGAKNGVVAAKGEVVNVCIKAVS